MTIAKLTLVCLAAATAVGAQDLERSRAVLNKVCGTCHSLDSVLSRRSRAQWQETINQMITGQGAKGTEEEFAIVLDYLASQYGPNSTAPAAPAAAAPGRGGRGRGGAASQGMLGGAGPEDKHIVDEAAADRGRKVWAAQCINCHGTYARGTDNGPNLIRSELVLHDRYGDQIGPFLKKGHPMQSGARSDSLTAEQMTDLAHFIHQRVYDTLRGSPIFIVHNVVTGDASAGKTYFTARCSNCHSPTGDLARIGARYDAATLQGRFLNPRPAGGRGGRGRGGAEGKPVTLTVTPPNGAAVTGTPVIFDDFDISVRDASGEYHAWKRTPDLKVVKNDPYAAHDELLVQYTDKNMHDILAYLVTLK